MKNILVVFTLLFAFTLSAQDNQQQDSLDELFELMNMDSMVNTIYDQMETVFADIEKDFEMSSEEMAINKKYRKLQTKVMKKEMSWQMMKVDLKHIYLQNFTKNEIAEMLAFYKSPTGQSVLRTMPIVMQESMQLSQVMAQKMMPKLQELSTQKQQALQELRDNIN